MAGDIRIIDIDDPNAGGGGPPPAAAYGIVVAIFPSDSRFKIAIRRAEDAAGSPDLGTIVTLDDEISPTERTYIDFLAPGSGLFHYATRHVPGGTWTCWRGPVAPVALTGAEIIPAVMPKPREALSQTATLGTLTLTIDDVQCRVTQVRMKSKAGAAAEGAYGVVAIAGGVYTGTVALVAGIASRITYEITFYNEAGALAILERVVTFGSGDIPQLVSGDIVFDASGAPTITLRGDALTATIKYAYSTSSQPTATTVRAAGAVAGPTVIATPAVTVNIGDLFFVSAFAYSAAGAESAPLLELQARRAGTTPNDPFFLVSAAHAGLTNERVVADTTTVAWNFGTPGVASASVPDMGINTAKAGTDLRTLSIQCDFGAAGNTLQWSKVPSAWTNGCRIVGVTASFLEGVSGSATFSIKRASSFSGAFADMIGAGSSPNISAAHGTDVTNTTGWTNRDIVAGGALEVKCLTLSGATYVSVTITVERLP